MKNWYTFDKDFGKFDIFTMIVVPNKENCSIDLIPGLRIGTNGYEFTVTISWLIIAIEFNYTLKEQTLNEQGDN